jgi:hypothetical protein
MKSRIELTDTIMDIMVKMSDGNPGAASCLIDIMNNAADIDPQDALTPLGPILALDTHGIYGSSIYILWSDKCGRDTRKMLMLLRAVQLGLFSRHQLKELAEDQLRAVHLGQEEFEALDKEVCGTLERFKRPELTPNRSN